MRRSFGNSVTGEIPGNTFLHVQTVELMENSPIDITKVNLCRSNETVRKGVEEVIERVARVYITRESQTRRDERTRDEHKLGEFGDCWVRARGNRRGMNNVS